jgi:hypothetical protein
VRTGDLQCNGWHERAGITRPGFATPAGKTHLKKLADITIHIGKVASGGVAVVGGNDQASSGGKTLDEGPKIAAGQLFGYIFRQGSSPWPAPEPSCSLASGHTVLPRQIDGFRLRRLQLVSQTAAIAL